MTSKLSSIQPGKSVIVNEIADSVLRPKLMEMGVIIGQELTVLFRAPFGDPIAVDVNGYMLSLRLDEAALIEVVDLNEETISFEPTR
jgi:ferrous iron transport protein A